VCVCVCVGGGGGGGVRVCVCVCVGGGRYELFSLFCLLCLNKVMFGDGSLFTAADKTGLLVMATKHGETHTHTHTHTHLQYPLLDVQ